MKRILVLLIFLAQLSSAFAQETFPFNGVRDKKNQIYYAFTNVTLFVDYQNVISNATLLIKDGIIEQVGTKVNIPKGSVIYDLKGKYIYPSFIDLYSDYGMPEIKAEPKRRDEPQLESKNKGPFSWNQAIKPETNAAKLFSIDSKSAEEYRKIGFGTVLTHQKDGIARGTSTLVCLSEGKGNEAMLAGEVAAHYSFSKGTSTQDYPSSLMGSIALLRQTHLDAKWYETKMKFNHEYNLSLDEWNRTQKLPQIFEVSDKLNALRADKIGDEFNVQYIIKGSGDEYHRINEIISTNAAFIIPLNFPNVYDVEDPYDAMLVSLEDMKHWELAPSNPAQLQKNNIKFALTASDLKDKSEFWKNLSKAQKHGLSSAQALKALTYTPAEMISLADKIGSLKQGMLANFIICSDTLFGDNFIIYENWIKGTQIVINDIDLIDIRGEYHLNLNASKIHTLKISGEATKPKGEIVISDSIKNSVELSLNGNLITLSFDLKDNASSGFIRLSGKISSNGGIWDGKGQIPNGEWVDWSAIKNKKNEEKKKENKEKEQTTIGKISYPLMAYGWDELPEQGTIIIKNVTIWTNEKDGILKNTDIAIHQGKIFAIGQNLTKEYLFPKQKIMVQIIDAKGKHLTPGIIDEHSHIAISKGVNEGTQAVTSEVRIGDVINSDDINIYRQLAGGVTAAQLLHGSENPIGGQSALVKLKWGFAPEEMKINSTDGFIKFALGENVKQSNWGERNSIRFPQTRMGVEQVFYDAFHRAKEYENVWLKYNTLIPKEKAKAIPPRRDLELETLSEILNKRRFITCHSYVQSEINMLMHVADSMGFRINTFTHILEGYKLADKMKKHNAGGSTFSDWWAYKYEVNDAIPHNAAIMASQGITTSINSDDAEMGRRLNQEAAKTIKYGNVPDEEALKMVTLNPAKLLHLDSLTGSIKVGKDADLVIWNGNPLSIYSKPEKTFVEGICYFDIERDKILRDEIQKEKARLIQKMIQAKKNGEQTQKPQQKKQKLYHCDTLEE